MWRPGLQTRLGSVVHFPEPILQDALRSACGWYGSSPAARWRARGDVRPGSAAPAAVPQRHDHRQGRRHGHRPQWTAGEHADSGRFRGARRRGRAAGHVFQVPREHRPALRRSLASDSQPAARRRRSRARRRAGVPGVLGRISHRTLPERTAGARGAVANHDDRLRPDRSRGHHGSPYAFECRSSSVATAALSPIASTSWRAAAASTCPRAAPPRRRSSRS